MLVFEALLERIAQGLDSRSIPYMVIGGQAVLVYGEPRLTRDVDVTLGVGPEKLPSILQWVDEIGWHVLVDSPADFVARTFVLPCADPSSGIRIDLVFSLSPYERQAIQRARSVKVGNATVRFAAVEDLIIDKVVAGRPRDLEDVRSILRKRPALDVNHVRTWLAKIDSSQEAELIARFEELMRETNS